MQKLENEQVGRVLRRFDRLHTMPLRFAAYDVNLSAISYVIDGVRACTLFFPKGRDHAANRALKLGWIDETDKWRIQVGLDAPAEKEVDFSDLGWHQLRKLASSKGLDLSGRRPDIENRLKEYFIGAPLEAIA